MEDNSYKHKDISFMLMFHLCIRKRGNEYVNKYVKDVLCIINNIKSNAFFNINFNNSYAIFRCVNEKQFVLTQGVTVLVASLNYNYSDALIDKH